jgi:hypothetical protein
MLCARAQSGNWVARQGSCTAVIGEFMLARVTHIRHVSRHPNTRISRRRSRFEVLALRDISQAASGDGPGCWREEKSVGKELRPGLPSVVTSK